MKNKSLKIKRSISIVPSKLTISRLIPNIITLVALCFGLTSIYYGLEGKWEHSIALIIIAALLDGMDGRIARYLNATSDFGANLDSLADFINFGVAPGILLYMWDLRGIEIKGIGWGCALIYSVCCALRLARFNVAIGSNKMHDSFFVGVNAPSGAILALLPMLVTFEVGYIESMKPLYVGIYLVMIGFLMASRIPTFSIKKLVIPQEYVGLILAVCGLLISALIIKPWITIITLALLYAGSIPFSVASYYKKANGTEN